MLYVRSMALAALAVLAQHATTQAHFPWLITDPQGRAALYFGEGLQDQTYKLPPALAESKVFAVTPAGEAVPLKLQSVTSDDFVGLRSEGAAPKSAWLVAQMTYGLYHGARLDYYAQHLAELPSNLQAYAARKMDLPLQARVVEQPQGLLAQVLWQGQPLAGAAVTLLDSAGQEVAKQTTDPEGLVQFAHDPTVAGLQAILVGHTLQEAGELDGKAYASQAHYLSVTFRRPAVETQPRVNSPLTGQLPPLPLEITSFGACRSGDALFVYGGHTGEAHSYSQDAQNNKLLKLDLQAREQGWQEIATGDRLQGLGMVCHGEQLIVLGGFTAMNAAGEAHRLHSQSTVRAFDLSNQTWKDLPPLPEPRSSFDAALLDGVIYVVGGWNMQGEDDTTWLETAWQLDLRQSDPQWTELPKPPFQRRAIATVAHQGKLFVIGGMQPQGGPTKKVSVYDPTAGQWSEVAPLIGQQEMAGFGVSGWSISGELLVTTYEGQILRWLPKTQGWEAIGETADARFFHRLLPLDARRLVSIGGANMSVGKYVDLEIVTLP